MWFNADGSGKSVSTVDMSGMKDMMQMMIEMELESDEESLEDETMPDKDWKSMDTMMVMYDIMPDSIKEQIDNPEVLKNIQMHMRMDSVADEFFIKFLMQYDDEAQYQEIMTAFSRLQEDQGAAMGEEASLFSEFEHNTKTKQIRIPQQDMSEITDDPEMKDIMGSLDSLRALPDDDFGKMMLLEIFEMEWNYIVHAPGKIISCNDGSAKIDGNTVEIKGTLIELMEGKEMPDVIEIRYK